MKLKCSKRKIRDPKIELRYCFNILFGRPLDWHPDHLKNLGYKIARILFLAGVKKVEHDIWWMRASELHPADGQPPLKKSNIFIYPSVKVPQDEIIIKYLENDRPFIWEILNKLNIGFCGASNGKYSQVSTVKDANLLADIVLHFNYFKKYFQIVKN